MAGLESRNYTFFEVKCILNIIFLCYFSSDKTCDSRIEPSTALHCCFAGAGCVVWPPVFPIPISARVCSSCWDRPPPYTQHFSSGAYIWVSVRHGGPHVYKSFRASGSARYSGLRYVCTDLYVVLVYLRKRTSNIIYLFLPAQKGSLKN